MKIKLNIKIILKLTHLYTSFLKAQRYRSFLIFPNPYPNNCLKDQNFLRPQRKNEMHENLIALNQCIRATILQY